MMARSLENRAAARRELTLRRARKDLAAFTEYVFGLRLAPHHRAWALALSEAPRLVLMAPVEHGKTTIASVALPLWVLGNAPDSRIALVSETHTQAARPLAAIREHILRNPRVREVFPNLRPARGARERWSDSEVVVERPSASKDPSVVAVGVSGPLLGARLDLAILDDVCSWENSFTSGQREKVIAWFRSTLVGRVVAEGRVVVVGTPWHREDLLHVLEDGSEYRVQRDPAMNHAGEPLWPEAWPLERLEQRRREIGEIEFSRQMLLTVLAEAGARFREAWVEQAFAAASAVGCRMMETYADAAPTFTGVDLAVGSTVHHDESALFTVALLPDGRRQVLSIEAGRWQAPEIVARIRSTRLRYRSRVRVESNAAQAYIAQFLAADGVHVDAHMTGRNRHDPVFGIESLAVELEQARWIVPDAPETRTWARELLAFSPAAHPGDRLVASWLAREAAREYEARPRVSPFFAESEFRQDEDEDSAFWVLGPSAGRPLTAEDRSPSPPSVLQPRAPERRQRPFILR
ncbi:MAG TPA: hypothetical protein VFQ61_34310 [Polyangiaceae bacterium]|nr:hypothetical protein [Polyangiaceae bacterium]